MKQTLPLLIALLVIATVGCGESQSPQSEAAQKPQSVGKVLHNVPATPDRTASYLIYLHGAIIETGGMRPKHPRFGPYEYASILNTFADRGFIVISEARNAGTRPEAFAQRVAQQVRQLVDAGVPEHQITVVGFSKGSVIAILASSEVPYPRVNWIFQAGCGPWVEKIAEITPHGRVLSLYDRADDLATSCTNLFDRMPDDAVRNEQVLDLGTAHGAFYTPNPAWVEPTIAWAGR